MKICFHCGATFGDGTWDRSHYTCETCKQMGAFTGYKESEDKNDKRTESVRPKGQHRGIKQHRKGTRTRGTGQEAHAVNKKAETGHSKPMQYKRGGVAKAKRAVQKGLGDRQRKIRGAKEVLHQICNGFEEIDYKPISEMIEDGEL